MKSSFTFKFRLDLLQLNKTLFLDNSIKNLNSSYILFDIKLTFSSLLNILFVINKKFSKI